MFLLCFPYVYIRDSHKIPFGKTLETRKESPGERGGRRGRERGSAEKRRGGMILLVERVGNGGIICIFAPEFKIMSNLLDWKHLKFNYVRRTKRDAS